MLWYNFCSRNVLRHAERKGLIRRGDDPLKGFSKAFQLHISISKPLYCSVVQFLQVVYRSVVFPFLAQKSCEIVNEYVNVNDIKSCGQVLFAVLAKATSHTLIGWEKVNIFCWLPKTEQWFVSLVWLIDFWHVNLKKRPIGFINSTSLLFTLTQPPPSISLNGTRHHPIFNEIPWPFVHI